VIGRIEAFEETFIIGLSFAGFKGEEQIVGMLPADI
jgi:hypothetical protein